MTVITFDRSLGEQLRGVREPVELRDERGTFLGKSRPAESMALEGLPAPNGVSESEDAFRRMLERMTSSDVSPSAFPIRRADLHERR